MRDETKQKLDANAQRRYRETLLGRIRADLQAVLQGAEFLVAPDSEAHKAAVFPFSENQAQIKSTPGYAYAEFENPRDAMAMISGLSTPRPDQPALLMTSWEGPLFRVPLRWGLSMVTDLYAEIDQIVMLWAEDLSAGVIIEALGDGRRCLYYQVAKWGTA